jgi:ABC-type nitrate/sulfonate/bicarbonate transport system substrate-binding protein
MRWEYRTSGEEANMSDATSGPWPVRVAPDWLPNTNHIGLYVADALGYYTEGGMRLEMLPFDGEAMPNRKLPTGAAEFGLMPQQSILSMRAHGLDVVSVAVLARTNTTTLMVRAESGITRPAELAGRRYASYGTDFEVAMIADMILADGGHGAVELVPAQKLDILQALYDGEIDVAWGFYAWEGIQAELAGHRLRHFFVTEYGVPNEYFPLLFTTRALIAENPETVGTFVRATLRGYTYAAAHPREAAELFLRVVDRALLPPHADELVRLSMRWLAPRLNGSPTGFPSGQPWGWHERETWEAFAAYIRRLAGEYGRTPPQPDAEETDYTNHFLVASSFA